MMPEVHLAVQMLGQSGCSIDFPGAKVYTDPYLSDSVRDLDAQDLERQLPIPVLPEEIRDADWVLITHDHIDHCDPHTVPKLAKASPQARFIAPEPALNRLRSWGVESSQISLADENWRELTSEIRLRCVPAAHPEIKRDSSGRLTCVGYLIEYAGKRIYIAGDTSFNQDLLPPLLRDGEIHTAFLPVNENNFFLNRRGIIGNMSVREAFCFAEEIGAKQVVPVHWDMFAVNSVSPEEIRLVHRFMNPSFSLLLNPKSINLADTKISVVIRTLNESRHLEALLQSIAEQRVDGLSHEVIIVDSGSTDRTLEIAERNGCRIIHIERAVFSYGRSLNMGCDAAKGDIIVITSGHCVPVDECWLQSLCQPIIDDKAKYVYGRQLGGSDTHFSESQIFSKYFPQSSSIPQEGYFCNNANSAIHRSVWESYLFNEELTGLEDMELAQRIMRDGEKVAYIAEAAVHHYHSETWLQVRRRFEREAIALQKIMPQVHVNLFDTLRYVFSSVAKDMRNALRMGVSLHKVPDIVRYRWNQYLGSYKGNHTHRKLSHQEKEKYFYPS